MYITYHLRVRFGTEGGLSHAQAPIQLQRIDGNCEAGVERAVAYAAMSRKVDRRRDGGIWPLHPQPSLSSFMDIDDVDVEDDIGVFARRGAGASFRRGVTGSGRVFPLKVGSYEARHDWLPVPGLSIGTLPPGALVVMLSPTKQ